MRVGSGLRLVGEVALAVIAVALGTVGVMILLVSSTFGEKAFVAAVFLAGAAVAGGALATLLRQDSGRWP